MQVAREYLGCDVTKCIKKIIKINKINVLYENIVLKTIRLLTLKHH